MRMQDDQLNDRGGVGFPPAPELSVLVLGYNSAAYLDACLGSIPAAAVCRSYEVLFVNNGTDSSEDFILNKFPDVTVLASEGNVGFAQANNRLARHAKGRWLLLLNPDTKLYANAIDELVAAAEMHPEYWLFGGMTVDAEGHFQNNAYPELPSLSALARGLVGRAGRRLAIANNQHIVEVEAINGGFMLVERDRWMAFGGLNEAYFLYAEDCDVCRRVRNMGGRIGLVPGSKIFHDIGSGSVFSPVRKRYQAAGLAQYFWDHHSKFYACIAIATVWLDHVLRFSIGWVLSSWKLRFALMSRGHADTALKPWIWVRGFRSTGADPRRTCKNSSC